MLTTFEEIEGLLDVYARNPLIADLRAQHADSSIMWSPPRHYPLSNPLARPVALNTFQVSELLAGLHGFCSVQSIENTAYLIGQG